MIHPASCLRGRESLFPCRREFGPLALTIPLVAAVIAIVPCALLAESELDAVLRLGILQNSPEHISDYRAAGVNVAIVELGWNRSEPRAGHFDDAYFREMAARIGAWRDAGFGVALDLGFQYPPEWIFGITHSRFVNQYGDAFESSRIGEEIPNAVFNRAVRDRQEAYLREVFTRLGSDFALVRLGWMKFGEIAYPVHEFRGRENCYWAFDDNARGIADGLPDGIEPCPVPGWMPGTAGESEARARRFLGWYLGALENYQDWQIRTVRTYTKAPLAVLYPSWGTRPRHNPRPAV